MTSTADTPGDSGLRFRMVHEGAELVPVHDAATVLLLRDGRHGVEVLMMRRNVNSDFVGGAYLFPGGAVDAADAAAAPTSDDGRENGPRLAAVREAFEEAGVLLAVDDAGRWVTGSDDWTADVRRAVETGATSIVDVCAAAGGRPAIDRLAPFSRWVTPEGAPRRYDTRFYVVEAPDGHTASADDRELTASLWITPDEALERFRRGRFTMIFPTAVSLETIRSAGGVAEVMDRYRQAPEPEVVHPTLRVEGDRTLVVMPDGRAYDARTAEAVVDD